MGCTEAGPQVVAARKPSQEHIRGFEDLVTGSWRQLLLASPRLEAPAIDRPRTCSACWRRRTWRCGADKWGDPRARLIDERLYPDVVD